MNILEALSLSVPYIHLALKEEAIVAVIDKETETVVKCLAGKRIDVGYQDGHKVNANDENIYTALKGQNSDIIIPEDVYGIFIYAFAFPIRAHGKVVGALAFGLPIDNKLKLEEYMNKMEAIINSLQDKVHNVASHSEELAATSDEINTQAQHALDDAKKTHEVTNLIKSISRQTNLLGLNASIEAARAGQHGAGFNIVAQEVRKLSSETSNATESIETSLRNINSSLENLKQNMEAN
ncbi:Chemotaxis protein OS=Lysinibacillus sphaericus OX=1421 GN=LS41612_07970 PE=3 SV=1 [Lysinibacillus sphaericus]